MNNNLKKLLETIKTKDTLVYEKLISNVDFLKKERLKIVGNSLRSVLGRESKDFDKSKIMSIMKEIKELSEAYGVEFNIPDNWEDIEKLLRLSILEDIQTEFERQS